MQGNLQGDRKTSEIEQLERMASYYDKLGCVDVARSLRRLAEAKLSHLRRKDNESS